MSSTIPYIGSKISLISNSEIRYEGILYTINTQESTIALQSVKTFGTEGRKIPEIPPSSEIYDFIIFRGQDIKDLTVLEGAQNPSSPMLADPAIMSMNQRPPGGPGKDGKDGRKGGGKDGGKAAPSKGKDSYEKGGGGGGAWGQLTKGSSKGMPSYSMSGGGRNDGWGKGGGKWDDGGKGRGGPISTGAYSKGGGKGKEYQASGKGKGEAYGKGKGAMKGGKDDGKGMQKGKMKGGDSKGGGYGKGDSKGDRGGKGRSGGGGGGGTTASGAPVGELLPEDNAEAKREYASEFDVAAANTKFDKVVDDEGEGKQKALSGYNKSSSFFDNISCEATDRATDADRQKVDRDKARQYDRETFGDTRRPPRPLGVRRGAGKGKGGGKGGYRS